MPNIDTVAADIKRKLSRDTSIDLEFLAQLFEDTTISDTGSGNELQKRLLTILEASSDQTNGGVTHFVKIFSGCQDRGFREAFQDPHPSSRNQVGHFMTAVDMGYRPNQTYTLVPSIIRSLWLNRTTQGFLPVEERVCMALIIGHEQVSDTAWAGNYFATQTATVDDVAKFFRALDTVRLSPDPTVRNSRLALTGIPIGTGVGNSIQDLHLSLYGYKMGKFIRTGDMTTRDAAALWIRTDLGGSLSDQTEPSGDTATA
jgi:hypothetical protein